VPPTADNAPKFVLSLGGGGYRGLFTIEFLTLLEEQTGPLKDRLSLVVGTSVGSINALGLAAGLESDKIRDAMVDLGKMVFPPERVPFAGMIKQVLSHRRDPTALKLALSKMLGSMTLGQTVVPALVTAVDITAGQPRVFRTKRFGGRDDGLPLVDVALASAAAPTYFPPHYIEPKYYADGGLFANAPDLTAAVEATTSMGWRKEKIRLLCIGATLSNDALASSERTGALTGIDWGDPREPILLQQIMGSQVRYSRDCARRIVGANRYIAVDPIPSSKQQSVLGLDVATDTAIKTLRSIAIDAFNQFVDEHSDFIALLKASPKPPEAL
jgi:patatin-like phospholipase/acyl hydrolase